MNRGFFHHFRIVSATHLMLVAAVILCGGFRAMFRKPPAMIVPVEFLVNVAPEQGPDMAPEETDDTPLVEPPKPAPPAPAPIPEPPKPKPKPEIQKKEPVKKPEPKVEKKADKKPDKPAEKKSTATGKKPVEVSHVKRTRVVPTGPKWASSDRRLSDAAIRRMLAMGATASDRNVDPGEDARCCLRIHDVLYEAWAQPSAAEAGSAEVKVTLTFRPDGTIVRREVHKTGNAALDQSVQAALDAVPRITGLSPAFLSANEEVTISFKVEQQ